MKKCAGKKRLMGKAVTGKPVTKLEKDTDRDFYMTPVEAKEYGLIDEIIKKN